MSLGCLCHSSNHGMCLWGEASPQKVWVLVFWLFAYGRWRFSFLLFAYEYSVVTVPFFKKYLLELYLQLQNLLIIYVRLYAQPYYPSYCSFLTLRQRNEFSNICSFKIVLTFLSFLNVHIIFRMTLANVTKKLVNILIWIC